MKTQQRWTNAADGYVRIEPPQPDDRPQTVIRLVCGDAIHGVALDAAEAVWLAQRLLTGAMENHPGREVQPEPDDDSSSWPWYDARWFE